MKKLHTLLAPVLILALLLSLAACAQNAPEATLPAAPEESTAPQESTAAATQLPQVTTENPVTFFSMSLGENYQQIRSLMAYSNEDGTVHVEYVGDVKKVADLEAWVFHGMAAELEETGLAALNGTSSYEQGEANGSMYIEFADGTMLTMDCSGSIPEAYSQGYALMDAYFAALMAQVPVYVPQPLVMGEVDEGLLSQLLVILEGSGIQNPDSFTISQVDVSDEAFGYTTGLSSAEGVTGAASCAPMMMTTAYSLVIVTLEDPAMAEEVCKDFEENLDWMKWVCVAPSDACIAVKENMVLCLMGDGDLFSQVFSGIQQAGWTTVSSLKNPYL